MKTIAVIFLFMSIEALAEIRIEKSFIKETFTKNVEVAGSYLHGLQLESKTNSRELYAYIPPKSDEYLCVDITGIDGRYRAAMEHKLDGTISGYTHIIFPTEFIDEINLYDQKSLAVLTSLKSDCSKHLSRRNLISSWSAEPSSTLNVFIRSSATHDLIVSENKENIRCSKILDKQTITYDKVCRIVDFKYKVPGQINIKRKNLQPIRTKKIKYN